MLPPDSTSDSSIETCEPPLEYKEYPAAATDQDPLISNADESDADESAAGNP